LRLAEELDVPLRERNVLFDLRRLCAGVSQRSLDDPALQAARKAVDLVLKGHEPYPAIAVDRHWHLVAHNAAIPPLLAAASPSCCSRRSTCCVSRCIRTGSRRGLRTLANGARTCSRGYAADRRTADAELSALLDELAAYPAPGGAKAARTNVIHDYAGVGRAAALCDRGRNAVAVLHHDDLRHAGRRHARRAGDRVVLPGRCHDCRAVCAR